MGSRALILGGGGPVGIAWEIGLAAGLEEGGVKLAQADRIVGTSAGSFVGAALAGGRTPESLVRAQVEQAEKDAAARAAAPQGERRAPPDLAPLMKLMASRPATGATKEWLKEVGAFSLGAKTAPEEAFINSFGSMAKLDEKWPRGYACTAVDAEDGTFVVWEESSGVELGRAIASSCSVPGIFPAITIHGRRYMDGGMRSGTSFDLGKGYERVLCVAVVGNLGLDLMKGRAEAEVEALRATGAKAELIIPDANCREAFGPNLMNASRRGAVAKAGVAQGRA
ncbi:MAG: patatin-like phospholipase family protein, partial [Alphaproteobacteria bacterium]|nr:patatin-like phospholipase family protein [Alphaproteobacteria bacterium]